MSLLSPRLLPVLLQVEFKLQITFLLCPLFILPPPSPPTSSSRWDKDDDVIINKNNNNPPLATRWMNELYCVLLSTTAAAAVPRTAVPLAVQHSGWWCNCITAAAAAAAASPSPRHCYICRASAISQQWATAFFYYLQFCFQRINKTLTGASSSKEQKKTSHQQEQQQLLIAWQWGLA